MNPDAPRPAARQIGGSSGAPDSPWPQNSIAPFPLAAIPDHELIRIIGRGSYGQVWLAKNAVGTLRAVKIVYRQTFEKEEHFGREFKGLQTGRIGKGQRTGAVQNLAGLPTVHGWPPFLSICAVGGNVRPMTIDERGGVVGRAVVDCGVVILAAGASSRMGQPKLLLPWGGNSVLGHLIEQWKALHAGQIAAVQASGDQAVGAELDRLDFPRAHRVVNPTPERGMFSSIQCAARWGGWNAELTHWVIVLGDQPHLRLDTLHALLDFAGAHSNQACQPSRRGRPRHPVVLPKTVFAKLKDSRAETLKEFLRTLPSGAALCELDDPGLDFDVDTPADYEQALRLFGES